MKGLIALSNNNEFELNKYNFGIIDNSFGYQIDIFTDLKEDFRSLITDKQKELEDTIKINIDVLDDDELKDEYINALNNIDDLLKNASYVTFDYGYKEIVNYIKNNPILKEKRILLNVYDLDKNIVKDINKYFCDTSNIYLNLIGNMEPISFKEYCDTLKKIDDIVKNVNTFNFSLLEKIMYVYDIVRDRVYKEENINENETVSRDLTKVLLGDKIVCVGYSILFTTILKELGIEASLVNLNPTKGAFGHSRAQVFIKDDKYNINGIYYFDATWDSKKKENDNTYLYSYRYFGMTKSKMDEIDKGLLIQERFPYFSSYLDDEFEEQFSENGFENMNEDVINAINYMSTTNGEGLLINRAGLIPLAPEFLKPNIGKIRKELPELIELFDSPISGEVLMSALFNVRKNEYYNNPSKYPFGLEEFYKIAYLSNWKFKKLSEVSLLEAILGETTNNSPREIINYLKENDYDKKIEQIKLVRTLKDVEKNFN